MIIAVVSLQVCIQFGYGCHVCPDPAFINFVAYANEFFHQYPPALLQSLCRLVRPLISGCHKVKEITTSTISTVISIQSKYSYSTVN